MITHRDHFHGSDLEKIEAIYGIKKEEITSFSANVNPLGISPRLRESLIDHIDAITAYPDREYTSLRRCLAAYAGTVPERIIVGNGSTELISLFIQVEHPKKAMILGPTYSEYEREVALGGGTTVYYPLKEELEYQLDPPPPPSTRRGCAGFWTCAWSTASMSWWMKPMWNSATR